MQSKQSEAADRRTAGREEHRRSGGRREGRARSTAEGGAERGGSREGRKPRPKYLVPGAATGSPLACQLGSLPVNPSTPPSPMLLGGQVGGPPSAWSGTAAPEGLTLGFRSEVPDPLSSPPCNAAGPGASTSPRGLATPPAGGGGAEGGRAGGSGEGAGRRRSVRLAGSDDFR